MADVYTACRIPKELTAKVEVGYADRRLSRPLPEHCRHLLVDIARSWLNTPYHHQAAKKDVGADCLGLIRGIYEEFTGVASPIPPAYSKAWGQTDGQELMLRAAHEHLIYVGSRSAYLLAGDVLIFRMRKGSVAKHAGMYIGENRMIHSFEAADTCEVELHRTWRLKIAAVFQFPIRIGL